MSGTRPFFPWPTDDERLLLRAALSPDKGAAAAFQEWRGRVDVEREIGYGSFRLLPLVYENQRQLGTTDPVMERLKGVYRAAWASNLQLFDRARPAAEALTEAGFDLLVIKGAALANGAYRKPGLRPMRDVDLAVRPGMLGAAVGALERRGWRLKCPLRHRGLYFCHGLPMVGPDGVEVDVHQRVLDEASPGWGAHWFWEQTEAIRFAGLQLRQPDPAGQLVHAIVHGLVRNPDPMFRWIPDAATLIERRGDTLDWDRLVAFARHERLAVRLFAGLRYLRETFDVAVPTHVLESLVRSRISVVERLDAAAQRIAGLPLGGFIGRQGTVVMAYLRRAESGRRLQWIAEWPDFLCMRWHLHRWRDILPYAVRQLGGRLVRRSPPPRPGDGIAPPVVSGPRAQGV